MNWLRTVFLLEQEDGDVSIPVSLAHYFHPIKSRSKNKHRNLWVGFIINIIYIPCIIAAVKHLKQALSKRHIYIKGWCGHDGVLGDVIMLFFLTWFQMYISIIVQDYLYHNMDIRAMWQYALVSCAPPKSIGLFLGCALLWCWVSLCVLFY